MSIPSPLSVKTDLVSFTILVNGAAISSAYQVASIDIEKKLNNIPTATICIFDGEAGNATFPISESSNFIPGNEIKIELGYSNSNKNVFTGIIVKHSIEIRQDAGSLLVIECCDKTVKMTIGKKNANYTNIKDSDVMSKIIGAYGLDKSIADTTTVQQQVVQYYSSDWDFMLSRANVNGQVVIVNNNKVTLQKPDTHASPVLALTYGADILHLDMAMDAESQMKSVQSRAWDIKTQAVTEASAKDPGYVLPGNISNNSLASALGNPIVALQTTAPLEKENLQTWADATYAWAALSKIKGSVSFQGSNIVEPGNMIQLAGLGSRFNGNAYVSGIKHSVEEGRWITEAEIGISSELLPPDNDITAPPASGLLPAIEGLQNGIVKKITQDPDGEYRVLVTIPLISNLEGVWARMGSMYATRNAGAFFYPEIGDEVIVAFLNNDPRYPIILGSLYSKAKTPPCTPDEKNTNKGIVTNSQLKVMFDDVKKTISITTPANNKIVLNEDTKSITIADQNNNTITMSQSGISINSASNIEIKAAQNIKMSANGNIDIAAINNATITGANVTAKAAMQATVQGSASAELSASGQVTVKGAMVMIN